MPKRSSFNVIVTSLTMAATVSTTVFPSGRSAGGPPLSFSPSRATVLLPQDFARSGGFQGQDIMGGAAIIFKRPAQVRDLVGGAALMVVKRQPRPSRPVEIARNTLLTSGSRLQGRVRRKLPAPQSQITIRAKLSKTRAIRITISGSLPKRLRLIRMR